VIDLLARALNRALLRTGRNAGEQYAQ
jgi:hypothetical protein